MSMYIYNNEIHDYRKLTLFTLPALCFVIRGNSIQFQGELPRGLLVTLLVNHQFPTADYTVTH